MTKYVLQKGFGSGEVTASLFARSDLEQYKMGATKIQNYVVLPQGALRTRTGFRYVGTAVNSNYPVRLIPFRYSSDQTYILEFGNYTLNIIVDGAYLIQGNGIYQVETPFSADDLKNIDYSQNADILTLTNPDYPPYELRRYNTLDWRFERVRVTPAINPPTSISTQPIYASVMTDAEQKVKDKLTVKYCVTAVNSDGQESVASIICAGTGNYYITGAKIRVSWSGVANAEYYRLYREVAGIFGFVGETQGTYIDDEGNNPDTTATPPKTKEIFERVNDGRISSISISNAGSGYWYGLYNSVYYLPRVVSLSCIPPLMSIEYTDPNDYHLESWSPSVKLDVINSTNGEIYNNPFKNSIDLEFATKSYEREGVTYYRRIAYISARKDITLTNSSLGIAGALLKFTINIDGGEISFDYDFSEFATVMRYKNVDKFHDLYANGVFINFFRALFEQANSTVEIPLSFSGNGSGASATVVCYDGKLNYIVINSMGSGYSSVNITVNSTVGSGGAMSANYSKGANPDYPSSVAQYDQRRVFAGSYNNPLKVWFTNAGYQDLMTYHQPVLADDRIEIVAVANDADRIRHIVALDSLLLMTGSSELRVFTQNSDALTPMSIAVRAQSFCGCNNVQPLIVNNTIAYASQRGGHVRALGYDYQQQGYSSTDISVRAPHLFDNKSIVSMSLQKAPNQIIWCVSSDGKLLGCSFLPEQSQIAWHRHTTQGGRFEDVCVINEGMEDHIYVVVNRNGVRTIERSSDFVVSSKPYYRCMDSYLDGVFSTAQSYVSGLDHLNGQTVSVWADGERLDDQIVSQGLVRLRLNNIPTSAKNICVGLPIICDFISVPLVVDAGNVDSQLQGRTKNISDLYLRVSYNDNLYSSNYPNSKNEYLCKRIDDYAEYTYEDSYLVRVIIEGDWNEQTMFRVRHTDPTPVELQAIIINLSYEGGK